MRALIAFLPLFAAACGDTPVPPQGSPDDPAFAAALSAPLATDPDLAALNEANAALTAPPPDWHPAPVLAPEEARLARSEAAQFPGGVTTISDMRAQLGAPARLASPKPGEEPLRRMAIRQLGAECEGIPPSDAGWAAGLPASFPAYPRSTVRDALGSDRRPCAFRAVRMRSAVAPDEVVRFYHARASAAGFDADWARDGERYLLSGQRGRARYRLRAWPAADGSALYDLLLVPEP